MRITRRTRRQLNRLYWQALIAVGTGLLALASSFGLLSVLFFIGAERQIFGDYISFFPGMSAIIGLLALLGSAAFTGVAIFLPLEFHLFRVKGEEGIEALRKDIKRGWNFFKFGNPVIIIPFVIYVSITYLWRNRSYIVGR